jgi:hypothetical protein
MSRRPNRVAALAVVLAGIAGSAHAYDDKSLAPPFKGPAPGEYEEGGYALPPRREGVQVFIGTPYSYNGYRPYYGPYMYGPVGSRGGAAAYVGPGTGYGGDNECRRWAWVHMRKDAWLWGIVDTATGEWRCAEW